MIAPNGSNQHFYASNGNGPIQEYHHQQQHPPYHIQHHPQHGEWPAAPTALPAHGGVGADMRGASPAKDSPGHSNRNSAASSDSGRGYSTGHTDAKVRAFNLRADVCKVSTKLFIPLTALVLYLDLKLFVDSWLS